MSIATMNNSTAIAGATMPQIIASLHWFRAFYILPTFALITMNQPAGRVLNASPYNGYWLRASPFICALDAIALIVRLLVYCALLHGDPRKAMLVIRRDRFGEFESKHDQETIFKTMPRFLAFLLTAWPLGYAWRARSEIKWTMAWAWMYIASFVVLEVIVQLTRHLRLKPNDASDAFKSNKDTMKRASDEVSHKAMESTRVKHAMAEADTKEKDMKDDNNSIVVQGQTCELANRIGQDDNDNPTPLIYGKSEKSTIRTRASDIEAANDGQDDNPLTSARFLRFKVMFGFCDTALLRIGCTLHVIFIYWAFLDILHPYLGNSIRSTDTWSFPIYLVSFPMLVLVLFIIMGLSFLVMFLLYLLVAGLATGLAFMVRRLRSSYHTTVREWMDRYPTVQNIMARITTTIHEWADKAVTWFLAVTERHHLISNVIVVLTVGPCLVGLFIIWSIVSIVISEILWTEYTIWVYELISTEAVVLLIFGLVCYGVRAQLKRLGKKNFPSNENSKASLYLDEIGVSLLTGVLISFVVLALWYRFRYPYFDVWKWRDNWREYLDF